MFFAGATFVTKGHAFRTFDWAKSAALLDQMLSSYDLADELTTGGRAVTAPRIVA